MDISFVDAIEIAGVLIAIFVPLIGYCFHVEMKLKKLEDEINTLNPIKEILRLKGEKHVKSVFEEKPVFEEKKS